MPGHAPAPAAVPLPELRNRLREGKAEIGRAHV